MPPIAKQSEGLPSTFYTLNEQAGTFDRITVSRTTLAPVDDQLKSLVADQISFIPRAFHSGRTPVHLSLSGKVLTLTARLPFIRLNTWWKLVAKAGAVPAHIVPVFAQSDGATRVSPQWVPPPNMAVFFLSTFDVPSGNRYNRSSLCAVCTDASKPGSFKLPLPNIYENGKICMGNDATQIQPDLNTPLSVCFDKSLDVFQSAPWNTDMLSSVDPLHINQYFSFSADDYKTPINGPSDWPARWLKCNNSDFNAIPFSTLV